MFDHVEWNLSKLKKEKILKRVGPDKGGHWEFAEEYVLAKLAKERAQASKPGDYIDIKSALKKVGRK